MRIIPVPLVFYFFLFPSLATIEPRLREPVCIVVMGFGAFCKFLFFKPEAMKIEIVRYFLRAIISVFLFLFLNEREQCFKHVEQLGIERAVDEPV